MADLFRGTYKAHDYGDVILPLVVLRRLDAVARRHQAGRPRPQRRPGRARCRETEPVLEPPPGGFYNTSPLTFDRLIDDEDNVTENLRA